MNILFLTLTKLHSLADTMVYTDMLHTLAKRGHEVCAVCPLESKDKKENYVEHKDHIHLLHANIGGNYFNVNIFEKGITLLNLEKGFIRGIRENYSDIKFDMVLYTTPPITFNKVVQYVKDRDGAVAYLMLKDIFPQNAIDLGMLSRTGLKGLAYRYFRAKEKKLYRISDFIGCMSHANIDYVVKHNPEITPEKVEMSPNSIIIRDMSIDEEDRRTIRSKYGIPLDKKVFIYGGNLGEPQGVDFIVECLRKTRDVDVLFMIVGDGTERYKLETYIEDENPQNVVLYKRLPKEDYDTIVSACDVGLIFLDHRFTIPNFPSRLLSYMQAGLPVLAATDSNTDIGKVITEGGFGWWCESNDVKGFAKVVEEATKCDLTVKGEAGFEYLKKHYDVEDSVDNILSHSVK